MTRAVILGAIAALCGAVLAAPAAAAKPHTYAFDVTDARISEVMTFQGDAGPACRRVGVCGYSGTVSYGFEHADGFAAFTVRGRRVVGFGGLDFGGLTSATVQGPDGGAPCTDKILRRSDQFEASGRPGQIHVVFHAPIDLPDFLDTYCTGPRDLDVAGDIPVATFSARSLRRRTFLFQTARTTQFHAGPFLGTLSFSVAVRLRRAPVDQLLQLLLSSRG
ncbi:MAG TPA: hypothetical protein VGI67_07395 [Thermoleophilaceae bacterium]